MAAPLNAVHLEPPDGVDPAELRLYLYERGRAVSRSVLARLLAPAALIGALAWLVLVEIIGGSYVPVLLGVVAAIAAFLSLMMLYGIRDARRGILYSCPRCRNSIRVTPERPASAWLCTRCEFNHFKYWRARAVGPSVGVSDVGDLAARAREAIELGNRAIALVKADRLEEAKKLLHGAIALWPHHADFHDELSLVYSRLGEHDLAIQAVDRAIEINPGERKFHSNRALRLLRMGRVSDAAESTRKALEIDPLNPGAQALLRKIEELERGENRAL